MKLFRCTCPERPPLHFENVECGRCRRLVGFLPDTLELAPFEPADGLWRDEAGRPCRLCANRVEHGVCNWMVPLADDGGDGPAPLCAACRLNRVIPDLSVAGNLERWHALEQAKRRCLFTFLELELPFDGDGAAMPSLGFRFMADAAPGAPTAADGDGRERVMTGHEDGIVTINLAEADEIARTRTQLAMRERYRTLLGHFRHETGHYVWDRLTRTVPDFAERFRARFGDERTDYAQALAAHYAGGPPPDWQTSHISAYATMHPWEDWAETWAHYLHIVDTLETLQSFGTETSLATAGVGELRLPLRVGDTDRAAPCDFDAIVALWIEVSVMLNSLNRSMGLSDPYPFVLNAPAVDKLRFVHEAVLGAPRDASGG